MALNIITAKFCFGATQAWASEAWQYDYGQLLQFDGIELPETYQVHFSNEPMTGETITQIGNADGVSVPDQFFQNGETVYAWVFLHEGEDDGETVYMVTIPVKKRPQPSDEAPTHAEQSAIDQAIAALNIAVEKADEAITHYPTIIDGTWHVWDVTTGEYVDTGVEAQGDPGTPGAPGTPGDPGFSPTVTVTEITGGHRVTITDESGEHTFDVMDGEGGGTITVDSAMSPTSENPVQNKVIDAEITGLKDNLNQLSTDKADIIISSAEGTVASFSDGAEYDAVSLIAHFEPVQEGTGDPSPDNVRPIHGWTGLDIGVSRKNFITTNPIRVVANAMVEQETGQIRNNNYMSLFIYAVPRGTLYLQQPAGTDRHNGFSNNPNLEIGDTIEKTAYTKWGNNIELQNQDYKYFYACAGRTLEYPNFSLTVSPMPNNEVLVASDLTTTTPISWQTEAGEVYGGYVDVTRGKVVAEYGNIASYNGETLPGKWLSDRDVYASGTTPTIGAQVVYELATPIEYDITPTAIELLKGYNNVWNSAGGNNGVQYRADTKLYVDGKQLDIRNTIAPIEDGNTASQAYAVGRYFYRNGDFCKAKTAIASGAAFTLGTNYEVTTVSAELYTALH